jgi:hypothetical protein
MRSMWRFMKLGTIGLLGLMMLVAVSNSGCKQEDELAESVSREMVKQEGGKIGLKILYAGHPGSEREEALVTFLREHFAAVQTCDLEGFKEDQAEGFAVTVMDYDSVAFKAPPFRVSQGFFRPLMTIGVAGAFVCGNLSLKMDYL